MIKLLFQKIILKTIIQMNLIICLKFAIKIKKKDINYKIKEINEKIDNVENNKTKEIK